MTKPNFPAMSKKELRAYVLAHRDDDEAFYAYTDKIYEAEAEVELAVVEWLKSQNSHQGITKVQENLFEFAISDMNGSERKVKIQIMASFPTNRPFIELLIEPLIENSREKISDSTIIFVSKNKISALSLEKELSEANFDSRTKSSRVVGYVESGKFQNI